MFDFDELVSALAELNEADTAKTNVLAKGGVAEPFTALFNAGTPTEEWVDFQRLTLKKAVILIDLEKKIVIEGDKPEYLRPEKKLDTFFYGDKSEKRETPLTEGKNNED